MHLITTKTAEHLDFDGRTLTPHPEDGTLTFPDGEVYIQLDDIDELDHAMVVHAGRPAVNTSMMQLYGTLELLQEHDVYTDVFFTYMPYSMQDEAFYDGSLNYARALLRKLAVYYDVKKIYAIDAHFSHRDWADEFPFENVHAFPLIANQVAMEDYVVVGPDLGAVQRFGIEGYTKQRHGSRDVEMTGDLDVEGENVLVFDDIVETGNTLQEAYGRLDEQGAERIEAAVVHGVMQEGIERARQTFDSFYLTNSIKRDQANVNVSPLIHV
jgi:ribose-phosphate pyrophosphokinase